MKYPITHTMEQGSDEWQAIRLGKVTASKFADAMAGGTGVTKYKLMDALLGELESGSPEPRYVDKNMEWGTETEPLARQEYEDTYGVKVKQVGFVQLNEFVGVSPDGLIGKNGLLEVKCPKLSTHIKYRRENKLPTAYKKQVQGQLWVTGYEWCDFVSYNPLSTQPLFRIRVKRDEKLIKEIEDGVNVFVEQMKLELEKLNYCPF